MLFCTWCFYIAPLSTGLELALGATAVLLIAKLVCPYSSVVNICFSPQVNTTGQDEHPSSATEITVIWASESTLSNWTRSGAYHVALTCSFCRTFWGAMPCIWMPSALCGHSWCEGQAILAPAVSPGRCHDSYREEMTGSSIFRVGWCCRSSPPAALVYARGLSKDNQWQNATGHRS